MWPGAAQIGRDRGGVDGDVNGGGAIAGGDAGGDAEPAFRVDADREGGGQLLGVPLGHLGQAELVAALSGQGQADQTPSVQGHEVDRLGRDQLGRADQITLVLAVLVVRDDDDLAVAQVVDRQFDGAESSGHARRQSLRAKVK